MIRVSSSSVGEHELKKIKSSFDNQWLGIGSKCGEFENLMSDKIGQPFALVDNCSNGLYMALKLLDLPTGSEVIVPSITWHSCVNAIILAGFKPVFADVHYDTCNVTTDTIANVTTDNTMAVIVLHYAGLPAIVETDFTWTISDSAHAIDTYVGNTHISKFSDIAVFSFDHVKNISCGELGGISSDDSDLIARAKVMRTGGMRKNNPDKWWEFDLDCIEHKFVPNDITASIAIAQLGKLDAMQLERKLIWNIYNEELADIDWLITPPGIPNSIKHSYFTYFIKVINGKRNELARYLLDNGIYTTVRFPALHLIKAFGSKQKLPVAEQLNEQLLCLPLHPNLTDDELTYIIETIKAYGKLHN